MNRNEIIREYPGKDAITFGTLKIVEMAMDTMPDHRKRTIRIWLPPTYDGIRKFPVLYMHDGQNLFGGLDDRWKWFVEKEMAKLSEDDQVMVVGVDTANTRFEELCPPWPLSSFILEKPYSHNAESKGDLYGKFITDIVKPFIDANFSTKPEKEYTGIGGSSMGGIESFYLFLSYPDIFGKALCFSVATGVSEMTWILKQLREGFPGIKEERIYLFNGGQTVDAGNILPTIELYQELVQLGMDYHHACCVIDSREPHYESCWQKYFADGVRYLFTKDNSVMFPPQTH